VHHYSKHGNQNTGADWQSRAYAWSGCVKRIPALAITVAATLIFVASFTSPICAAPGDLDPTFNPTGSLPGTLARASSNDYNGRNSVLIQPDGKLLIAGSRFISTVTYTSEFEIWRYNPDGSPDTAFANAGLLRFSVNPVVTEDALSDVALLPDGRFVVGGTCKMSPGGGFGNDFCLVRFKPNGSIDTTFGNNGIVTTEISAGSDYLRAIALQSDGKIVAAGQCSAPTALVASATGSCVARFLEDGSLDTAFGTGGKFTQQLSTLHSADSIKLQSNGSIVFVGTCGSILFSTEACVTRLTSTGALDTTFNSTGNRSVTFVGYNIDASATPLLVQPDGRIVVGAACYNATGSYFCIAKLNVNGTYMSGFGYLPGAESAGNGRVAIGSVYASAELQAMRLQSDGKLVVSGNCSSFFCVARLFDDGLRDLAFGTQGMATVDIVTGTGSANYNDDVAIDREGRIIATGQCVESNAAIPPNEARLCIARLDGGTSAARNCNLDIDGDGQVFSTTDALIMSRAAAKVSGSAIIGGITFPANATRNTWPLVRDYLVRQCGMSAAP
jgi:uncharacterized delta-60 repeat protein